jgi:glycerol-3-phosphate O-acyltransferase/dihydroxyacetone phosphate acyltransferase
MYDAVFNFLVQDRVVGIFPEEGSNDWIDILPIKAGITIMALSY